MKQFVIIFAFLFSFTASAQTKKPVAKTTPPVTSNLAGKTWKIKTSEEFGVEKTPTEKNKEDFISLKTDGSFSLKREGVAVDGAWKKTGAYIYFTPTTKVVPAFNYKVVKSDDAVLQFDWREDAGLHTLYTFEAK